MKTNDNGHFYIFKTKNVHLALNETPKKDIHISFKTKTAVVRISVDWEPKNDIIIKNARWLTIGNKKKRRKKK